MEPIDRVFKCLQYLPEAGGDSNPNSPKLARVYPIIIPSDAKVVFPVITCAEAGGANFPPVMRGKTPRPLIRIAVTAKEYKEVQETMKAVYCAVRKLLYVEPDPPIDNYDEILDAMVKTIHITL